MWRTLLLLFCTIVTILTSPSADFKPCSQYDKECLIQLVDKLYQETITGNSALHIDSLDPSYHEEVDGDVATLKYKLRKTTIKGFKNCKVVDAVLSNNINSLHLKLDCPLFNVDGLYEIDGKILTFPIQGKGDYSMEFNGYHIMFDSELVVTERGGKKFIHIKSYKYSAKLDAGKVDLQNLFNGQNKELADAVLKVMNENWPSLSAELQGPVFKVNLIKVITNFNKVFKDKDISTLIT